MRGTKTHKLNLSTDGNDRAIAGISSGGICSFTAAWERPDAFRRVFSNVGSFGAHRGGYVYPILVRKVEPKPIRVFLQDGSHDLKFAYGDWWLANQEMEQALTFAGYEVAHSWDKGGHEATYATKIFPDVMRWLWKDWPRPIKAGAGSPNLQQIVLPGEAWKPVAGRFRDATSPTASVEGEVFFCDAPANKIYKIGLGGDIGDFVTASDHAAGLAYGPGGLLYATAGDRIVSYDAGPRSPCSPRTSEVVALPPAPTAMFMRSAVKPKEAGFGSSSRRRKTPRRRRFETRCRPGFHFRSTLPLRQRRQHPPGL